MKLRIISGVIGALLLIFVLFLGTPFIELAVSLLAVAAVCELFYATNMIEIKPLLVTAVAATVCMMVAQSFDKTLFAPVLYVFMVALFAVYIANRDKIGIKETSTALMLSVYVAFMFGHIIYICNMERGNLLIWMVFVSAFLTDTFAMFGGKFFGRHKLCPKLSPKKTVEGGICGVIGCLISVAVYCMICEEIFLAQTNYINALVIGLGASVISQLGDLSASCIKRQFGIKDYGNIMPGHGGVMDRFDSVLFVAPYVYYALYLFPIFGQ